MHCNTIVLADFFLCIRIDMPQNLAKAKTDPTFGKNFNAMAKSKKAAKRGIAPKIRYNSKNNDTAPDQEEIISKITEETRVLKGIIQRFSKPVSDNDDNT